MTVWVECPTNVLGAGWTGSIVPLTYYVWVLKNRKLASSMARRLDVLHPLHGRLEAFVPRYLNLIHHLLRG